MASRMMVNTHNSNFRGSFVWKIVNFSVFKNLDVFRINGHVFIAKYVNMYGLNIKGSTFTPDLYPETSNFITIRVKIKDIWNIGYLTYKLGIIRMDGSLILPECGDSTFDEDTIYMHYCLKKDTLENIVFFPDGSLIIIVEFEESAFHFSTMPNFRESTFSVDKICFNYFVESLYSFTPLYLSFECPVSSKYMMFVFKNRDNIKLELKNYQNPETFLKKVAIKVTLFDINDCQLYSRWYTMQITKDKYLYELQPSIPVSLILERKSKDKKEISFNLLCELHEFNLEKECVISTNYVPEMYSIPYLSDSCYKLSDIQKDFLCLFKEAKLSDIKLEAGGRIFQVHRIILSARSPILREILENSDLKSLNIPDVDDFTVAKFLKYLYSGIVEPLNYEIAFKLLFLSNRYQVNSLKDKCSFFLKKILSEKHISPVTQ